MSRNAITALALVLFAPHVAKAVEPLTCSEVFLYDESPQQVIDCTIPDLPNYTLVLGAGCGNGGNITNGESLVELKGHIHYVSYVAFSADGNRIVTASTDGIARVWDCVSYRDRLPAIEAIRRSREKMRDQVNGAIECHEDLSEVVQRFPADSTLS